MESRILAVLFDLDGVIVHTDAYHYKAWKQLADEKGWDFNETINHQLRGVSRLESLRLILEHNGIPPEGARLKQLAELKNSYYVESLKGIGKRDLFPGSIKFVRQCRDRGLRTALCSSSKNAQYVTDKLKISTLFDTFVTGWDITKTKPDPQIFLLAAERLGVSPRLCVVFEDADSGIEAAKAAGMKAFGVGGPDRFQKADKVIQGFDEVSLDADL
jgi:beta-phosphoglucomutase